MVAHVHPARRGNTSLSLTVSLFLTIGSIGSDMQVVDRLRGEGVVVAVARILLLGITAVARLGWGKHVMHYGWLIFSYRPHLKCR